MVCYGGLNFNPTKPTKFKLLELHQSTAFEYLFNSFTEKAIKKQTSSNTLMIRINRFLCFLIVFSLVLSFVYVVYAATFSLNVQAGKELMHPIELAAEDRVKMTIKVLGQTSSSVQFWILFPNSTNTDYGEISYRSIEFASEMKGICELHFDNSNSSEPKLVTLNYEVEHYFLGIPQIPFILIVITVFLLLIAAGYMIMGKYS